MGKQLIAGLCGSPGRRGELDPWPPITWEVVYRNKAKLLREKSFQRSQRASCQTLEGGQGAGRPQRNSILRLGIEGNLLSKEGLGNI